MADIERARRAAVARILEGDGTTPRGDRRAAFDGAGLAGPLGAFVGKVAAHAHRITDDDIAALRNAGLDEDAIFELAVCAAIGEATRQHETAMAALESALKEG